LRKLHRIFVVDRCVVLEFARSLDLLRSPRYSSGSMTFKDRGPLPDTPVTGLISQQCNNRMGAVYSALHSFWMSRQNALGVGVPRRDAYSTIFFNHNVTIAQENDFRSSPNELLRMALQHLPGGGTDFASALRSTQVVMQRCWSTERCDLRLRSAPSLSHATPRTPIIIFLSDGECSVTDQTVQDLARAAVDLGYFKCLCAVLQCSSYS
jgi:hypothetical protein